MESMERIITGIHRDLRSLSDGQLADYIPELAMVDPDRFGIAIATLDGHVHTVGDAATPFTIQSVSKAFAYAMALQHSGTEVVDSKVGLEPSGEAFNEISLEPGTGRPLNPMINAGAIAITALTPGANADERFAALQAGFSSFAGRPLDLDHAVFESERRTGHRNRAIAHLLRNHDILDGDVEEDLELYFRQCSLLVTARDLAIMGATLANNGVNPISGEVVLSGRHVDRVTSVMASCGMYDASGRWVARVGLPAKSGVGGGIVGVLPGQLAIAVFSPRLGPQGNSVRGVRAFETFSERFNLHLYNGSSAVDHVIRRWSSLADLRSTRRRRAAEREVLEAHGASTAVLELQGDVVFAAVERISRGLAARDTVERFIVDLFRVGPIDNVTRNLLAEVLIDTVADGGGNTGLTLVDPAGHLDGVDWGAVAASVTFAADLDAAIEEAEAVVLASAGHGVHDASLTLAETELMVGLDDDEIARVEALATWQVFAAGTRVCALGDEASELFIVSSGMLEVLARDHLGGSRRVGSMGPGVSFGEVALVAGGVRSADVVAAVDTACFGLDRGALDQLEQSEPRLYATLLKNMLLINMERMRFANRRPDERSVMVAAG